MELQTASSCLSVAREGGGPDTGTEALSIKHFKRKSKRKYVESMDIGIRSAIQRIKRRRLEWTKVNPDFVRSLDSEISTDLDLVPLDLCTSGAEAGLISRTEINIPRKSYKVVDDDEKRVAV